MKIKEFIGNNLKKYLRVLLSMILKSTDPKTNVETNFFREVQTNKIKIPIKKKKLLEEDTPRHKNIVLKATAKIVVLLLKTSKQIEIEFHKKLVSYLFDLKFIFLSIQLFKQSMPSLFKRQLINQKTEFFYPHLGDGGQGVNQSKQVFVNYAVLSLFSGINNLLIISKYILNHVPQSNSIYLKYATVNNIFFYFHLKTKKLKQK